MLQSSSLQHGGHTLALSRQWPFQCFSSPVNASPLNVSPPWLPGLCSASCRMQRAASGPGLVTFLSSLIMVALRGFALALLALGLCQGFQPNFHHEEPEFTAEPSKFGSLWPLPQKIQMNKVSFKLSVSTFQITDAPESSAGPSCSLLQNAYRRSGLKLYGCY